MGNYYFPITDFRPSYSANQCYDTSTLAEGLNEPIEVACREMFLERSDIRKICGYLLPFKISDLTTKISINGSVKSMLGYTEQEASADKILQFFGALFTDYPQTCLNSDTSFTPSFVDYKKPCVDKVDTFASAFKQGKKTCTLGDNVTMGDYPVRLTFKGSELESNPLPIFQEPVSRILYEIPRSVLKLAGALSPEPESSLIKEFNSPPEVVTPDKLVPNMKGVLYPHFVPKLEFKLPADHKSSETFAKCIKDNPIQGFIFGLGATSENMYLRPDLGNFRLTPLKTRDMYSPNPLGVFWVDSLQKIVTKYVNQCFDSNTLTYYELYKKETGVEYEEDVAGYPAFWAIAGVSALCATLRALAYLENPI